MKKRIELTMFGSDATSYVQLNRNRIPCVAGDFLDLPFDDRSFDIVVSVRQLPHIRHWRETLAEFCRVAKSSVIFDYPPLISFNILTPLLFRLKQGLEGDTRDYNSAPPP